MIIELTKVGDTFNTEYFVFEPDILVVNPRPGYKDNVEAARSNMEWQQSFARKQGRKYGLVVVLNNLLSQDAESRKVYSDGLFPELFYGIPVEWARPQR